MMYRPPDKKTAQECLETIFCIMDKVERDSRPKPPKVIGPRENFFQIYKKEGYLPAKLKINEGFNGREVFTDEIIIEWFEFKQKIVDVYKEGTIEDAYKKADEINKEVGYSLVKKEYIDKWVKEERKKASKEENQKSMGENDDAR